DRARRPAAGRSVGRAVAQPPDEAGAEREKDGAGEQERGGVAGAGGRGAGAPRVTGSGGAVPPVGVAPDVPPLAAPGPVGGIAPVSSAVPVPLLPAVAVPAVDAGACGRASQASPSWSRSRLSTLLTGLPPCASKYRCASSWVAKSRQSRSARISPGRGASGTGRDRSRSMTARGWWGLS